MPEGSPNQCSVWDKNLPYYQLEDLEGSGWGYYTGGNKGMRERCWKGERHSGEA